MVPIYKLKAENFLHAQLGHVGCPRVSAVSQCGALHSHPEVFPRLHQVAVAAARPAQETGGKKKIPTILCKKK
jgi:hypothetical protein